MGHFVAVMPKFPARIIAGTGMEIIKSGTTYTFNNTLTPIESEEVIDKGIILSGTVTFNASAGRSQRLTVGGALTVAYSGWPVGNFYAEVETRLINGGAFAITWPAAINWMNGDGSSSNVFSSMGVTLAPIGNNFVVVWSEDGGATLFGRAF